MTVLKACDQRFNSLNATPMITNYNNSQIEKIITDYMELQEMSRHYSKKRSDLEKEYNKLLTNSNGEEKNYTLEQADKIYKTYCDMLACEEQSKIANDSFIEAENKLKEIGQILYEATIHAEISLPAINGTPARTKSVMVTYINGQVVIR